MRAVSDGGDWRLMGQERYLTGRALRLAAWFTDRSEWDHDHCEFCSAKISNRPSGEDEFDRGYVTADDDYHWICEQCFADFRDRFNWTVVPSA